MNLGGIIHSLMALTSSLAAKEIAGNIASTSDITDPATNTLTPPSQTPIQTARGITAAEKVPLPDTQLPVKSAETVSSHSLIGLRAPTPSSALTTTPLNKLVTSYFAAIVSNALAQHDETIQQSSVMNSIKTTDGQTKTLNSMAILPSINREESDVEHPTNTASATSNQTDAQMHASKRTKSAFALSQTLGEANTSIRAKQEAFAQKLNSPFYSTESSTTYTAEKHLAEASDLHKSTQSVTEKKEHLAQTPKHLTEANDLHKSTQSAVERKEHLAQASLIKASLGKEMMLGQELQGPLVNQVHPGSTRDALMNALGHEKLMGQMQGMDAVILNAAMIPGWPAPRPFEMPKQLTQAYMRQILEDKSSQLGTSTRHQTKEGQEKDQASIQNYLLNMGMKKSILSRLRKALQPAKRKVQLLFGLAVLVTQAVFTLHTVLDELNSIEEDEDDMMQDPNEKQRRLTG